MMTFIAHIRQKTGRNMEDSDHCHSVDNTGGRSYSICHFMRIWPCLLFAILAPISVVSGPAKANEIRADTAVKITSAAPRSAQNPVFSPDGKRILYTRFLHGYNRGPSELVMVGIDGRHERILVPASGADNVNVPYGSWVGNRICFASDRVGDGDEIWILKDDGSDMRQVTNHSDDEDVFFIEPVFNPRNNNQIAFEYVHGRSEKNAIHRIAYLDVSTGRVKLLTDGQFDDRLPSWSSDGQKLLFQRNKYGQNDGWDVFFAKITVSGNISLGRLRQVFHGKTEYTDCSWGPKDKSILCSSPFGALDIPNIWNFPLSNKVDARPVTQSRTAEDSAPSASPNGEYVAFESHFGDDEKRPSEIWIIETN